MLDLLWVKVPLLGSVASAGIHAGQCLAIAWDRLLLRARESKELLYIKGFITGFERARESCQAKTEDDEAGASSIHCSHYFIIASSIID